MAPPPPQMMPQWQWPWTSEPGDSIRSLRLRSKLSQRQLAARMSVAPDLRLEDRKRKGYPTLSSLERLARALEVTGASICFLAVNATARKKSAS